MATRIQIRRGEGTPPNDLAIGELAYDTLNDKLYIGTGNTAPNHYQEIGSFDTLAEFGITASAAEINVLDDSTATTNDLNQLHNYASKLIYLANVSTDIVSLLNAKATSVHTHGNLQSDGTISNTSTIATGDRLVISDAGALAQSSIQFGAGGGFLRQDGTWANPDTDTDTTYTISSESATGGREIRITGSDESTDGVDIVSGQNISITGDSNTITVSTTNEILIPKLGGSNVGSNSLKFQGDFAGTPFTKSLSINTGGVLNYENNVVWHAGNDGPGSGLNADLLDGNDSSYFLPASHDMTLTLAGDATGSATFTNMGNATLTVAIADDSHNHTISNIDNLQTSLNALAPVNSPEFTGTPTAPTPPIGDDSTKIATTEFVTNAALAGIDLNQRVEWNFVGFSLDPYDTDSITISSNDLGENFDWVNYDYKFVFDGSTNGEDNSALSIRFDDVTTVDKYSWLYHKTVLQGATTETEVISGDNGTTGASSNQIYTGLSVDTSSGGGQLTGVNCEFVVSRTVIAPSAGMPGWTVRGEGVGHYFPSTQTLSTAFDGAVQTKFTGTFRQDNAITSVQIIHGLTVGDPNTGGIGDGLPNLHNIVRVYKRKRIFSS